MIAKRKRIGWGRSFKNFRGMPRKEITDVDIPEKVIIPLKQGYGEETEPIVEKGQKVLAGEIIARNDNNISSPVHSSVNGVIDDFINLNFFGIKTTAVIIKSDKTRNWISPLKEDVKTNHGNDVSWESFSSEEIERRIYLTGVSCLGNYGIPTHFKSSPMSTADANHIIINCLDSDVYDLEMTEILQNEELSKFVVGIKLLKKILPQAVAHIAINKKSKNIIDKLEGLLDHEKDIIVHPLESKYPINLDPVVAGIVLDEKISPYTIHQNKGILIYDVSTILNIYEGVVNGKPLIERIVALAGEGYIDSHFLRVRIGISFDQIINRNVKAGYDIRFILESPLWGEKIEDLSLPLDRTVNCIVGIVEGNKGEFLSFARPGFTKDSYSRTFVANFIPFKKHIDTNLHGEERPCIFCGYCEDVCPVEVIPHFVAKHVERNLIDDYLVKYKIFDCIECHLCTYVCPSKIRISDYIREGKQSLIKMGIEDPGSKAFSNEMNLENADSLNKNNGETINE